MDPLVFINVLTGIAALAGAAGKGAQWAFSATATDEGFIRAYYLEVSRNIEILKALDIASLKNEEINSPRFKSIIQSLQTEIGASLLCTNVTKRKRLLDFLGQGLQLQPPASGLPLEQDDEEARTVSVPLMVNVVKALWFTVHKIELLKALSLLEDGPFIHSFRLNVRIANIQERFLRLRIKLAENGAIQPLL